MRKFTCVADIGDLAAAVLGFEKHQSEHSDQRDQDRQQAEQDHQRLPGRMPLGVKNQGGYANQRRP